VVKTKGKRALGSYRRRWNYDIKIDFKKKKGKGKDVDWINLAKEGTSAIPL
jgi:hypothetical protein